MLQSSLSCDLPVAIYDCFTDTRFGGNVGGIVLNADSLSDIAMQNIAREINAPVTGFVIGQDGRSVSVRFFMPAAEIAMCGHVTVGLFSHLTQDGGFGFGNFTMQTAAGEVPVTVTAAADTLPTVMMNVSLPHLRSPVIDTPALAAALGVEIKDIGALTPPETAQAGLTHLFVQFRTLDMVQDLTPDFRKLAEISADCGVHTIACFSMQTRSRENTLHIRDFCPAVGADEVPASGTTNGALAGYLVRHGLVPEGPQTVLAEQGGELGRPSVVRVEIDSKAGTITRARVGGQAIASIRGVVTGA